MLLLVSECGSVRQKKREESENRHKSRESSYEFSHSFSLFPFFFVFNLCVEEDNRKNGQEEAELNRTGSGGLVHRRTLKSFHTTVQGNLQGRKKTQNQQDRTSGGGSAESRQWKC